MTMAPAEPLFSLVLCVYGVEPYIARAVRCLLDQRCGDFELILVDDASPDASIETALNEAAGDARVRVVRHESNRGLSAARNTGLETARGRYVCFPDPDDETGPDFLSTAAAAIEAEDPDIVVEGLEERYLDGAGGFVYANRVTAPPAVARGTGEVAGLALPLEERTLLGYVHTKFFRRALVADLRFDSGLTVSEDFFFSLGAFERARTVCVLDVAEYRYQKRSGSLTGGRYDSQRYTPDYYDVHRARIQTMLDFLEAHGIADDEAMQTLGALYGRYVVSTLMRQAAPVGGLSKGERRAWARELKRDPLFQRLIPVARARRSRALAVSLGVLRSGCVPAMLALGTAVSRAKAQGPGLVTKIQSER